MTDRSTNKQTDRKGHREVTLPIINGQLQIPILKLSCYMQEEENENCVANLHALIANLRLI